jgi:transcription antitermination protein NusB
MANRHLARSIVLQTLFEWDFLGKKDDLVADILLRNIDEFASGVSDISFLQTLSFGVVQKNKELDKIIEKAAPEWPIDKISIVDRNVLRIGLYELLFSDRNEVPAKVAINEAIELAKTFSGETSGKFVNGVLGAVYKEIGEPGKDDQSPNKKKEVPFEEMIIERKAGAVVYIWHEEELYFALIHDVFGHWTLSKGGVKEGETAEEAAVREIKEEMGLDIEVKNLLGDTEYVANHPEKGKHRKQVKYFLAEAKEFKEPKLGESGGLDDVKWFKAKDIVDLNFYNDIVPLMTQSVTILMQEKSKKEKNV